MDYISSIGIATLVESSMLVLFALISFCLIYESQSKPFKLQLTWNNEVLFLSQTFDVDDDCKQSDKPNIYCPWKIHHLSEQQLQKNSSSVVINLPPNDLNLMCVNQHTTDHKSLSQNVNHLVTNIDCLSYFLTQSTKTVLVGWRRKCFAQSSPIKFENYVNLFQLSTFFNNKDIMDVAAADIIENILSHGETVCLTEIQVDSTSDISSNPIIMNVCEDLSTKDWFSIVCSSTNFLSDIQKCIVTLKNDLKGNAFKRIEFLAKVHVLQFLRKNYSDIYDRLVSFSVNSLLKQLIFKQKHSHAKSLLSYRKELNMDRTVMDESLILACKISPVFAETMIRIVGHELNISVHDTHNNNLLTLLTQTYHLVDASIIDSSVVSILQSYPSASSLIDKSNVDGYTPYMIAQEMNHTRLQDLFDQFRQPQIFNKLLNQTYETNDHNLSFHNNRIQNQKFFEQFAKTYQKQEVEHERVNVSKPTWFLEHESHFLMYDQIYLEMKRQFDDTFIIQNIAIPLAAYTDETALRIELFDKMKALARTKYENFESFLNDNELIHHDDYHSNAIQLAWKIISAIALIRQFNATTKIDCDTDETNQVLSPYLVNVPIQYYHGSYSTVENCMDKDEPNFAIRFRYMYRAIWIHSTKVDLNLLKHPTNFNSWSLELDGAFSVVKFFANQIRASTINEFESLGSWPFRYLLILVSEIDWNFAQSVTKWYPNTQVALEEKEVVIPPFCNYEINPNRMTLDDLKHTKLFRTGEYQRIMMLLPFFGKPLRSKDIVIYKVTKINCENWNDWFAKIPRSVKLN